MRRITIPPRANLMARAEETGFSFVTVGGEIYWDERAYYAFTMRQIEQDIEDPSNELADLCQRLVDRAVRDEQILVRLGIPSHAWDLIAESRRRGDPALYGRFDLAYDGDSPAKLLEYNADTPTALFEASVFQWIWLEDAIAANSIPAEADQFNSLHEALIARMAAIKHHYASIDLHLACMPDSIEDRGLIDYLAGCATQAGLQTKALQIGDVGDRGTGPFVDLDQAPISLLFKLYPWEWMLTDAFARSASMHVTRFIEPPWKAILSTKAILPLLWEMAPGHPNLLPSYFPDDPRRTGLSSSYVRKPFHSREGSNITIVEDAKVTERSDGPYEGGRSILQALAPMPSFDGNVPVIGSWIIGDTCHGIGVREDASRITRDTSRFVPHAIVE